MTDPHRVSPSHFELTMSTLGLRPGIDPAPPGVEPDYEWVDHPLYRKQPAAVEQKVSEPQTSESKQRGAYKTRDSKPADE